MTTSQNLPDIGTPIMGKNSSGDYWVEKFNGEVGPMTGYCELTKSQFNQIIINVETEKQSDGAYWISDFDYTPPKEFVFEPVYGIKNTSPVDVSFSVKQEDIDGFKSGIYLHFGGNTIIHVADSPEDFKKFMDKIENIYVEIYDNYF